MKVIFHETLYKYITSSDNMQRTRTVNPPVLFTEFFPFSMFSMETVPVCNFKTIADNFIELGRDIKPCQLPYLSGY